MAYNEVLVSKVREALIHLPEVEEKQMFQGLTFMVNGKMCIGIRDDEIMCRIDPEVFESALERGHCRPMIHGKRTMQGYVFVNEEGYKRKEDFEFWVGLALAYNPRAKASGKKSSPKK